MIDGSEKRNGWLNFELQSPHVIERRSKLQYSSEISVRVNAFQTRSIEIRKRIYQTRFKNVFCRTD